MTTLTQFESLISNTFESLKMDPGFDFKRPSGTAKTQLTWSSPSSRTGYVTIKLHNAPNMRTVKTQFPKLECALTLFVPNMHVHQQRLNQLGIFYALDGKECKTSTKAGTRYTIAVDPKQGEITHLQQDLIKQLIKESIQSLAKYECRRLPV